jgi:multiple sugar transport system substrate-binding protein
MKGKVLTFVAILTVFSMLLVGCDTGAAPTATSVPPAATDTPAAAATTNTTAAAAPTDTAAAAAPTNTTAAAAGGMMYSGVEVNVLTFTGPQIAEPLQRRAPDFAAKTGAKINVVQVPFSDLYQKILTDLATKTNSYQAFVFDPQWMGDFVTPGYLEDLSARVTADKDLQWDDIAPFFRDFSATYQGKVYTIPLDGDFQMVYYRKDLLDKDGLQPPQTWDDYLAIAKKYMGQDLNGDGKPDYGSCISKKRSAQAYWFIMSVAGGFLQAKGTGEGAFFDTTTMKPLTNNDAFAAALDVYKSTGQYAPPDELNLDVGDTRGLFTSGRCALSMDWGDIGPLSVDPKTSTVQDKVGAAILPGSKKILDRATGKLVDCTSANCPNAINGVNHAPYAAFGGWAGAINAADDPKVKEAAYAFLSYMSQPAQSSLDVTLGKTGFNPYRTSHFTNLDPWIKSGMSEAAAKNYLGAIQDSLKSPNMVLDLRVPKSNDYQGVVLDKAVAQFLAGELTREAAMKQITDGWEQITDQQGRDKQLAAYKASLGVTR